MSTHTKYVVRAAVAGLIAGLGALVAVDTIDMQAVIQAVYLALGGAAAYLGIGAATPIEPDVGVQAKE